MTDKSINDGAENEIGAEKAVERDQDASGMIGRSDPGSRERLGSNRKIEAIGGQSVDASEWGDEISVDGVRPAWLSDDQAILFENGRGDWLGYRKPGRPPATARTYGWVVDDTGEGDHCPLHIRLPADHFAYTVFAWNKAHPDEQPFEPWAGGEVAPIYSVNGGDIVLLRNGQTRDWCASWEHAPAEGRVDPLFDVIGYRPCAAPTHTFRQAGGQLTEVLSGHADTEGEAVQMARDLNCPMCGGSGHVYDTRIASVSPPPSAEMGAGSRSWVRWANDSTHQPVKQAGNFYQGPSDMRDEALRAAYVDADRQRQIDGRVVIDDPQSMDEVQVSPEVVAAIADMERDAKRMIGDSIRARLEKEAVSLYTMNDHFDPAGEVLINGYRFVSVSQLEAAEDAMLGNATLRDEARVQLASYRAVIADLSRALDEAVKAGEAQTAANRELLAMVEEAKPHVALVEEIAKEPSGNATVAWHWIASARKLADRGAGA